MTRPLKLMPTPSTTAAGATASVNCPLGLTFNKFLIFANVDGAPRDLPMADWGTYFDDVRIMVDGDAEITYDVADLVAINQSKGRTAEMVDGVLPLHLSQPNMRTIQGEDQTGFGTLTGIESLTIELDIKTGVTINELKVYAKQSEGRPFGPHLKVQRYRKGVGVTGEVEISDINKGPYAMLGFHIDTDQINSAEVHADQRKIIEFNRAINDADLAAGGRVPQTGYTHIDFVPENRLVEALPMNLADFRLLLDFAATGNFSIYAESLQG